MKIQILLGLVAAAHANIFSDIGHALGSAVDTVGDGVKDAANTVAHGVVNVADLVGDGIKDAAHTVGHGIVDAAGAVGDGVLDAAHAIENIGNTLDSTFGDVWNIVRDPLEAEGKHLLVEAGTLLLEESIKLALDMMAAGKREASSSHSREDIKAYLTFELLDEYQKWLADTKSQILDSKEELATALRHGDFSQLPTEIRAYINEYGQALLHKTTGQFVLNQASTSFQKALSVLDKRMKDRLTTAVQNILINMQQ